MGKIIFINNIKGDHTMKKGHFDAREIASYFLAKEQMTNKKLQKLCYYAQAWYFAFFEEGLFSQPIEAWVHGPVVVDVYDKYRGFRWNLITLKPEDVSRKLGSEVCDFLNDIYDTYGEYTGDELEALTHSELPWQEAREGLQEWEPSHNEINAKTMCDYYWEKYDR